MYTVVTVTELRKDKEIVSFIGLLFYIFRRQIDIPTYQLRKINADTSLCLFADDVFP